MSEAINLALHCAKCGQLFTIALRPTRRKPPVQPEKVDIACPSVGCTGKMAPRLYAEVLGVWSGDGPEGVAHAKRVMAKVEASAPELKNEKAG
jgi:hypothetical protein